MHIVVLIRFLSRKISSINLNQQKHTHTHTHIYSCPITTLQPNLLNHTSENPPVIFIFNLVSNHHVAQPHPTIPSTSPLHHDSVHEVDTQHHSIPDPMEFQYPPTFHSDQTYSSPVSISPPSPYPFASSHYVDSSN